MKSASIGAQRQDTRNNAQVSTGVPEIVDKLLELFKKRDYRDNDARTPLHLAVFHNRSAYVRRLLDSGADITVNELHLTSTVNSVRIELSPSNIFSLGAEYS